MAKTIENKKVTIKIEGLSESGALKEISTDATYMELIYVACKRPTNPQGGFTWDDIEKINRIKDYYEKSKNETVVSVEDADLIFIIDRVKTNTWNSFDVTLLDFKKYIESLS